MRDRSYLDAGRHDSGTGPPSSCTNEITVTSYACAAAQIDCDIAIRPPSSSGQGSRGVRTRAARRGVPCLQALAAQARPDHGEQEIEKLLVAEIPLEESRDEKSRERGHGRDPERHAEGSRVQGARIDAETARRGCARAP
jgi:hypothetical protein